MNKKNYYKGQLLLKIAFFLYIGIEFLIFASSMIDNDKYELTEIISRCLVFIFLFQFLYKGKLLAKKIIIIINVISFIFIIVSLITMTDQIKYILNNLNTEKLSVLIVFLLLLIYLIYLSIIIILNKNVLYYLKMRNQFEVEYKIFINDKLSRIDDNTKIDDV